MIPVNGERNKFAKWWLFTLFGGRELTFPSFDVNFSFKTSLRNIFIKKNYLK